MSDGVDGVSKNTTRIMRLEEQMYVMKRELIMLEKEVEYLRRELTALHKGVR